MDLRAKSGSVSELAARRNPAYLCSSISSYFCHSQGSNLSANVERGKSTPTRANISSDWITVFVVNSSRSAIGLVFDNRLGSEKFENTKTGKRRAKMDVRARSLLRFLPAGFENDGDAL